MNANPRGRAPETERPVGVALAGGRSRRLGLDKATLPVRELGLRRAGDLLDWTLHRLAARCEDVLLAGGDRAPRAGAFSVPDGPGRGPAAGILGAARARPGRRLLVLACDLPRVPVALLDLLIERAARGGDLTVPESPVEGSAPRLEPLCAVYSPPALDLLEARVSEGAFDLQGLGHAPGLRVQRLKPPDYETLGLPTEIFRNLNRPDDLAALRQSLLQRRSARQ
ncbi:MAG: molybdenum cofactor guanylyltransferase [Acidobacteriota bacterium]